MVTMTVFITDARHGDRFTQLRKEIFDNFPASALITVAGLARPEMLVEVSGDRGTWLSQNRETLIVHRAQIPFAREMPGLIVFSDGQRARDRKFADSPLEGDGFELPVPGCWGPIRFAADSLLHGTGPARCAAGPVSPCLGSPLSADEVVKFVARSGDPFTPLPAKRVGWVAISGSAPARKGGRT